ncbi:C2 family cysteine protease [Streptomyces sp. SAS_270]|uniref:C2 family cysteine protease n=1 Tax=Streptomyces sp. SAS_270 TaxID=3412748 RepID=UPI00403D149F
MSDRPTEHPTIPVEAPVAVDTGDAPDPTEAGADAGAPQPTETAEPTDPTEAPVPSEARPATEAPEPLGPVDVPEAFGTVEPLDATEPVIVPEAPEVAEAPEPLEATEVPTPPEPVETPEPLEPSEAPELADSPPEPDPAESIHAEDAPDPGRAPDPGEVTGPPPPTPDENTAPGDAPDPASDTEASEPAPAPYEASEASDSTSDEDVLERSILKRLRDATAPRRESVDKPSEARTTVDRPDFNAKELPETGVPQVRYGTPLDRPDGTRVPLFEGQPTREQTAQGSLGDCGIIATMGGVAGHRPEMITQCVREVEDGTYEVRLHQTKYTLYGDTRRYESTGEFTVLTVTPELPVMDGASNEPAYGTSGDSRAAWTPILEKAIAGSDQTWDESRSKKATGYARLDRGSRSYERAELLTQLTGETAYTEDFPTQYDTQGRSPDRQLLGEFREQLADGHPIIVGTIKKPEDIPKLPNRLIPSHAYEVTAVDEKGFIHLRNPHNHRHPDPLRVHEFRKNFLKFYTTTERGK